MLVGFLLFAIKCIPDKRENEDSKKKKFYTGIFYGKARLI